jgi:hypothetical protein
MKPEEASKLDKEKEFFDRIIEVTDKLKNTTDPKEKELLEREFWILAIDSFNTLIAGTITLADGRTLTTPPIEL